MFIPSQPPIAFTISTTNHLSRALPLADSMTAHAPEYAFFIVLVDPLTPAVSRIVMDDHRIVPIDDLKVSSLKDLMAKYDPAEVCFSLKPVAFRYFFGKFSQSPFVVYFDSDVMIYHPIHRIEALLSNRDVVLTPHLLRPYASDGKMPDEFGTLRTGYFNMGFAAMANRPSAFLLLDWWWDRMIRHGHANRAIGLSADQFWMAFAPHYFDGVYIDRHPGMNVAYWNLHERNLSDVNDRILVNGQYPLIFIHFSGFDPQNPHQITNPLFFNRFSSSEQPVFARLSREYTERLLVNHHDLLSKIPSPWFSNGKQLAEKMREQRDFPIRIQYVLVYLTAKMPLRLRRYLWRLALLLVSHIQY